MPEVTVILTVYNGERYIAEAIDGVRAQTVEDWELIVINDGSTDRSADIARGYGDPRIQVHDFPNRGQPLSRNHAASIARGRFFAICDADDVWRPHKLDTQVAAMRASPDVGLAGLQRLLQVTDDGEPIAVLTMPASDEAIRTALARGINPFAHSALVWRRDVFEAVGGYNPRFLYAQDFEMVLRAKGVCRLMNVLGPPLLDYRVSASGIGRLKREMQKGYRRAALLLADRRDRGEPVDEDAVLAACLPAEDSGAPAAEPPPEDADVKYAKIAMIGGRPWRAATFLRRSLRRQFRLKVALLAGALLVTPGPLLKWACAHVIRARTEAGSALPEA